ncbi:SEFIR domain-containing protein [Actinomadura fibrosa]|uniref:SEFIR domain-containing protein n=1 Tax=Actinomadura fibrosa TaxID=111802 RepID=A0ABW2Y431_9ACTN|nr:SEFIR domain-containing protein [Actinomadura fibrosa]
MSLEKRAVQLVLIDEGARWVNAEPDGTSIGAVTLHSWEIHPVDANPEVLGEKDAYLIKVNYDLDLGPDPAPVRWFEVGLEFTAGDGLGPVAIADALPRTIGPEKERVYSLNRRLQFVPRTAGMDADAVIPATTHRIDVFGVGANLVRWQNAAAHEGSVRSGSQVAWLSLFVPRGCTEVAVSFSVRYSLPPEEIIGSLPGQNALTFPLVLKEGVRRVVEPVPIDDTDPARRQEGPRLFICYAHDTVWHETNALKFAELLRHTGVDVHIDKWAGAVRRHWGIWAEGEMKKADFVAVVASPRCKVVGEGNASSDENRGMRAELNFIREKLAQDESHWLPKVLPVVLPGETVEHLPDFLQPHNCDRYPIDEFTEEDMADLLRAMGRTGAGEWSSPPR